jgi:epoxide hydrolase 4
VLWGVNDPYLSIRLVDDLSEWVPALCVRRFPNAGHWLQLEEPYEIATAIAEFASEAGSSP